MKTTGRHAIGGHLARAGAACMLALSAGALMAASAAQAAGTARPACPAPVVSGATATVTCRYSRGGSQYWTVPTGVSQATFVLYGAAGRTTDDNGTGGTGGTGAEVTGTLPVTPGSVLQVNVGQAGATSGAAFGGGGSGDNGAGGGGGASDIRDGTYTLADRLLVAGGGGGGGANGADEGHAAAGGAGGDAGSAGSAGASAIGACGETLLGGGGGGAGTATMGGAGGAGNTSGASCGGNATPSNGAAGAEGIGGAGSNDGYPAGGGGGGGGYYGGGGGASDAFDQEGFDSGGGGGGGGTSYTGTASGASVNDDPATAPNSAGEVIITYHPVAVTNHSLSGHETAVSCLTASRCVAAGSRGSHGVVVTLASGAQRHATVLHGSSVIYSVSCPSRSGCWAIGRSYRAGRAYLVKISSAGRPAAARKVALPAGTTLGLISCVSMTSCEVAGNRTRPALLEIGSWNGTKLHLYQINVPGTQESIGAISCWHSGDCEAVGSARHAKAYSDLILTVQGGKPGTLNTNSGYALSAISCISATTCYAAGAAVLVTVTDGVVADPQAVPGGWNGNAIECTGGNCEAAGGEVFGTGHAGVLVSLSDGAAGSPVIVRVGRAYTGIAARGSRGFIAIGPRTNSRSEDTVG